MSDYDTRPHHSIHQLRRLAIAIDQRLQGINDADDLEEQKRRAWIMYKFLEGYMSGMNTVSLIEEEFGNLSDVDAFSADHVQW